MHAAAVACAVVITTALTAWFTAQPSRAAAAAAAATTTTTTTTASLAAAAAAVSAASSRAPAATPPPPPPSFSAAPPPPRWTATLAHRTPPWRVPALPPDTAFEPLARLVARNATVAASTTHDLPAPAREALHGLVRVVRPFCVRQGVGWLWLGSDGDSDNAAAASVVLKHEARRRLSPAAFAAAHTLPRVALQPADHPAVLVATASRDVGSLYHLVWAHLAAVHTLDRLRAAAAAAAYAGSEATVYLQAWDGGRSFGGVQQGAHYFRPFYNTYAENVAPADAFGAPRDGDVVCHESGLVGSLHMHYAARGGGVDGRPAAFGELVPPSVYNSLLAAFGVARVVAQAAAEQRRRRRRLLVLQRDRRRLRRVLLNEEDVVAWAEGAGWEADVVVPEERSAAEQYAAVSGADVVFQMHGSGMAWALLVAPGKVFAEVLGRGGERNVGGAPGTVSVNGGVGTYGRLAAGAGFLHVAHLVADARHMPWMPWCKHNARMAPVSWKPCCLVVPRDAFLTILRDVADPYYDGVEGATTTGGRFAGAGAGAAVAAFSVPVRVHADAPDTDVSRYADMFKRERERKKATEEPVFRKQAWSRRR